MKPLLPPQPLKDWVTTENRRDAETIFFLCKHLGICTQKMTEMPRSTKLAKFATVHNIFTTVQKISLLWTEKSTVQISFFYCAKSVTIRDLGISENLERGSEHPVEIFFCVRVSASRFRHLGRFFGISANFCCHPIGLVAILLASKIDVVIVWYVSLLKCMLFSCTRI